MAKIRLSLRRNVTQTTTTVNYNWSLLNNSDIRDKYMLTVRNKFDALQKKSETHTPNDEYENFVNAPNDEYENFVNAPRKSSKMHTN